MLLLQNIAHQTYKFQLPFSQLVAKIQRLSIQKHQNCPHFDNKLEIIKLNPYKYQEEKQMKKSKWLPEEDKILQGIVNGQTDCNEQGWEKICRELNRQFPNNKTPKQCRDRYVNYVKFSQNYKEALEWTKSEEEALIKLYLEHGPTWNLMSTLIPSKSQNSLKNKFHNGIRKVSNILHVIDVKDAKNKKRSITQGLLIPMIDLSSQAYAMIKSLNYTPNSNSSLFRFRETVLRLSCNLEECKGDTAVTAIRLIKDLNLKLRCFGVFKVKNRKNWRISLRSLKAILKFDNLILESEVKLEEDEYKSSINFSKFSTSTNMMEQEEKSEINQCNNYEHQNLEENISVYLFTYEQQEFNASDQHNIFSCLSL